MPGDPEADHEPGRSDPSRPADVPGVVIVANVPTPYRIHLHRRIAREMPDVRLWSAFTHEGAAQAPWELELPAEIGPAWFGRGQPLEGQSRGRNALREWRKGGRIIRWMRGRNIRAVVLNGYNDLARVRVLLWCRRHRVPCLLWGDSNIRGDVATGVRRRLKRVVVPTVLRRCDAILACGRLGRQYFERYGAAPERIFQFPVEPDYGLIEGIPPERVREVAARFGIAPGRRRLVFSGRLVPDKRPDLVVQAFAAIANARPEWDLLVLGIGPLRESLEASVPAALRGRVTFAGFVADPGDVACLYRACDVLVLPSDWEPWGLVVNEALAAGMAVLSSDRPGATAELVRDGVNGRVFPAGDVAAFREGLVDVTHPQRTDVMRAASRGVLEDWRRRGDPVAGLRAALRHVGTLPGR